MAPTDTAARAASVPRNSQPLLRWPFWNCPAPKGTKLTSERVAARSCARRKAGPARRASSRRCSSCLGLPALALQLGQLGLLLLEHGVEEVDHHGRIQQAIHAVVRPQLQQLAELLGRLGVLPLVQVGHPQHPVGAGDLPLGLQPGLGVQQRPQQLDGPGVFPPVERRPPPGELDSPGVDRRCRRRGPGRGRGWPARRAAGGGDRTDKRQSLSLTGSWRLGAGSNGRSSGSWGSRALGDDGQHQLLASCPGRR